MLLDQQVPIYSLLTTPLPSRTQAARMRLKTLCHDIRLAFADGQRVTERDMVVAILRVVVVHGDAKLIDLAVFKPEMPRPRLLERPAEHHGPLAARMLGLRLDGRNLVLCALVEDIAILRDGRLAVVTLGPPALGEPLLADT